jgi:hypothetical protein
MSNLVCANCGIAFSVPDHWTEMRKADHRDFWCPNGHGNVFRAETEADIYKRLMQEANAKAVSFHEKYLAADRKYDKTSKELKRLKKRTAAGVCPCCSRTVSQLARHMETRHKEYLALTGLLQPKALPAPKDVQ